MKVVVLILISYLFEGIKPEIVFLYQLQPTVSCVYVSWLYVYAEPPAQLINVETNKFSILTLQQWSLCRERVVLGLFTISIIQNSISVILNEIIHFRFTFVYNLQLKG